MGPLTTIGRTVDLPLTVLQSQCVCGTSEAPVFLLMPQRFGRQEPRGTDGRVKPSDQSDHQGDRKALADERKKTGQNWTCPV